jgi:hypothetical protein
VDRTKRTSRHRSDQPDDAVGRRRRLATASDRPTPGWQGWDTALANPRPPSVPATLNLNLAEYFTAAALIGSLSAQTKEPDPKWACEWSFGLGERMASEAQRRRRSRGVQKRRS